MASERGHLQYNEQGWQHFSGQAGTPKSRCPSTTQRSVMCCRSTPITGLYLLGALCPLFKDAQVFQSCSTNMWRMLTLLTSQLQYTKDDAAEL